MRIIAGINRGRKLQTLEGLSTRPTLDGTKEAIFSSLGGMLPGFVVLDVFGGSGALSLESISRGAKKAYILDNNLDAIEIIKKNAQTLNSMKELTILYGDYKPGTARVCIFGANTVPWAKSEKTENQYWITDTARNVL